MKQIETLISLVNQKMTKLYGTHIPKKIQKRITWELNYIEQKNQERLFLTMDALADLLKEENIEFGLSGNGTNFLISKIIGINHYDTDINSEKPIEEGDIEFVLWLPDGKKQLTEIEFESMWGKELYDLNLVIWREDFGLSIKDVILENLKKTELDIPIETEIIKQIREEETKSIIQPFRCYTFGSPENYNDLCDIMKKNQSEMNCYNEWILFQTKICYELMYIKIKHYEYFFVALFYVDDLNLNFDELLLTKKNVTKQREYSEEMYEKALSQEEPQSSFRHCHRRYSSFLLLEEAKEKGIVFIRNKKDDNPFLFVEDRKIVVPRFEI